MKRMVKKMNKKNNNKRLIRKVGRLMNSIGKIHYIFPQPIPEYIYYHATQFFQSATHAKEAKVFFMFDGMVQKSCVGVESVVKQPLLQEKLQNPPLSALKQKIMPLLNPDKKYYTPSFYLEEEKKYYTDNDERVQRSHKQKVEEDENSDQTIWVPRHARKRNYCFVCKEDYTDYLEHLNDQTHKKCLRNNFFTGLILELQEKFAQQNKDLQKQDEKQFHLKREMPTEDSSSISTSDRSPKSFQFIRKITKPNEELHSDILKVGIN